MEIFIEALEHRIADQNAILARFQLDCANTRLAIAQIPDIPLVLPHLLSRGTILINLLTNHSPPSVLPWASASASSPPAASSSLKIILDQLPLPTHQSIALDPTAPLQALHTEGSDFLYLPTNSALCTTVDIISRREGGGGAHPAVQRLQRLCVYEPAAALSFSVWSGSNSQGGT